MQNIPIAIFRGDDTDALGYQTIVGTIRTDLDLTGCKAVFKYLSFSAEFDPIPEDKKLTVIIPASETKKFPPGLGYASLRVYDSEGKLCTFSNRIMVFVATKTPMFGNAEFEVDFNVRPELEPLKIFVGPNPDDFDEYRGFLEKVIDRASAEKYGLAMLLDAIDSDLGASDGVAATPAAVKAAYAAVIKKLTDDYYTKDETEEAIDRVAAYYITYDAAGNPFPTYAALANATTVYSGGAVRVPTRNDYCVVLADETHDNAEYRYIYAVAEGQTTGSWQPQFPVEGVMTVDQSVTKDSQNPVSGGGVWSAIWGALTALPTGFSSLYDWCVSQLAEKMPSTATGADIAVSGTNSTKISNALNFKVGTSNGIASQLGNLLAASASGRWVLRVRYDEAVYHQNATLQFVKLSNDPSQPDQVLASITLPATDARTLAMVNDIPVASTSTPLMDGTGSAGSSAAFARGDHKHPSDTGKINVSGGLANQLRLLIAATSGSSAGVYSLRVKYEEATFHNRARLEIVKQPAGGSSEVIVASINLPASDGTLALTSQVDDKVAKSGDTMTGNLIIQAADAFLKIVNSGESRNPYIQISKDAIRLGSDGGYITINLPTQGGRLALVEQLNDKLNSSSAAPEFQVYNTYAVGDHVTYNGALYRCTTAVTTAGAWDASKWTADTMTDPDAVLDITSQNQLRVVAKDGTLLWAQGYDLASTSSATLACDAVNNFTFADGATTQAFSLPTAPAGKVGDFGLDIDNSANTGAATMTLTGLDTAFSVVVPEDESLTDMLAIAAGELARFYVTLTTFRVNNLPTWHIMKQIVENGGATV